jgi:hypothetical protein
MSQPTNSDSNQSPKPGINQQANDSTLGGGMQGVNGDDNILIQSDSIVLNIEKIITKSVWSGAGGLKSQKLTKDIEQEIFNATKKYVTNYTVRHGILKVLGMREPVNLEDVYTAVQFLGKEGIWQFTSVDNLETAFRQTQKRRLQSEKSEKKDGLKVANKQQYLMVLGQPGAGKSTFLRRMGLEALKSKKGAYQHECIPVFLELKRFNTGEINLEKAITEELKNCGFPKPEDSTKKLLEKGKLLILLDGLDEVPTNQLDAAITQIQDFVDQHNQNRFIASCRTAAYRSSFQRFVDVVMADFDDDQIQQFITNWFQSESDKRVGMAQKCWELLQQSEYAATKELAQTPLLLTLLCLVFDDSQAFPKNRASLYKEALDVLLKKWAAEKRIQRDPIYKDLSVALEEMMLAEIAHSNFVEDRLFFSQREVVEQIRTFLADNLNAPQHLDGEVILEAIQIQQGILVERAKNVLSFSHLTIQEYLTAQHIADNNLIEQLVTEHLIDQRWKEVFVLVAGLMRGGADSLLLLMEQEVSKLINPKLEALLRWAERETDGTAGNLKAVGKCAVALSIAIANAIVIANANAIAIANANANANAIANVNANANANANAIAKAILIVNANAIGNVILIANATIAAIAYTNTIAITNAIANAIANAFTNAIAKTGDLEKLKIFKNVNFTALIAQLEALKSQIPDAQQPPEVCQSFAHRFMETWVKAFNLTPELVDFSKEEIKAMDDYLYANHLIIQCKEAAVRVSLQTWHSIESRMLTIRNA